LTAILVFFGTLILGAIVILVSANLVSSSSSTLSTNFNLYIQQHPNVLYSLGLPAFLTGPISGIVTYLLLKRKHSAQLKELSSLTTQMKRKLEEYDRQQNRNVNREDREGLIEDAFLLTDQILTLLPEIARKRNQDSLLFGVVAFLLAAIVGQNFGLGIIAGVLVWLYFRYETNRSYEREISKFEEQKRIYEQRKNEFLETL
jgi:hypothetical protein